MHLSVFQFSQNCIAHVLHSLSNSFVNLESSKNLFISNNSTLMRDISSLMGIGTSRFFIRRFTMKIRKIRLHQNNARKFDILSTCNSNLDKIEIRNRAEQRKKSILRFFKNIGNLFIVFLIASSIVLFMILVLSFNP